VTPLRRVPAGVGRSPHRDCSGQNATNFFDDLELVAVNLSVDRGGGFELRQQGASRLRAEVREAGRDWIVDVDGVDDRLLRCVVEAEAIHHPFEKHSFCIGHHAIGDDQLCDDLTEGTRFSIG
jgi:hypothetical protein